MSLEGNQNYVCVKCGWKSTGDDLRDRGGEIKCTICGHRVLAKEKSPIFKRIKTE